MNAPGRYSLANSPDWQSLLNHFEFSQGFALIILLVPNAEGAAVTRDALYGYLAGRGQALRVIDTGTIEKLTDIPNALIPADPPESSDGAVWVERVVSAGARDYVEWREAWRRGVTALNQHRNRFRRAWPIPVIFVGDLWLQEVLRDNAPDLWSVRTVVAVVEPNVTRLAEVSPATAFLDRISVNSPDPEMALSAAAKLRGQPGSELALARLLYRAGLGFAGRRDWVKAVASLAESLELRNGTEAQPQDFADTYFQLGRSLFALQRLEEAERCLISARSEYERASDWTGQADATLALVDVELRNTRTATAMEHGTEALAFYRKANNRLGEADCLRTLADISLRLSDNQAATEFYSKSISLYKAIGHLSGEANCLKGLGDIAFRRSDASQAKSHYDAAIDLFRSVGDISGEGSCLRRLGDLSLSFGDAEMARSYYTQALGRFELLPASYGLGATHQRLAQIAKATGREKAALGCGQNRLGPHWSERSGRRTRY